MKQRNSLAQKETKTSENIFIAEYMLNKISSHALMKCCNTGMRCVLNQSFYVSKQFLSIP